MKLTLKNIGKVRMAEIALEGLTVIGGVNGTGKSTIGKGLFTIYNLFYNLHDNIRYERQKSIATILEKYLHFPWQFLMEDAEKILGANELSERKKLIEKAPMGWGPQEGWGRRRVLSGEPYASILRQIDPAISMDDQELIVGAAERAVKSEFGNQARCVFSGDEGKIFLTGEEGAEAAILIFKDGSYQVEDKHGDSFFPGADKAVYIDNAVSLGTSRKGFLDLPRQVGHQRDLDRRLAISPEEYNLVDHMAAREKLSNILEKINNVSFGSLIQDDGEWLYRVSHQEMTLDLALPNVSTGVLAFSILKRLLENGSLQERGVLILDEPETHLHPAWQLTFAEIIVLLCRDFELKILINTHSHYFLNAMDVFSKKHGIEEKCRYYLAENHGDVAEVVDATDALKIIYEKLWRPLQDLEDAEAELEERAEEQEDA